MKTIIELFTSPTCPFCPRAKQVVNEVVSDLKDKDIELVEFDVSTSSGEVKANEYGIASVPQMVFYTDAARKVLIEGAPERQSVEKAIRIAQGKEEVPQKKTFSTMLKSILRF